MYFPKWFPGIFISQLMVNWWFGILGNHPKPPSKAGKPPLQPWKTGSGQGWQKRLNPKPQCCHLPGHPTLQDIGYDISIPRDRAFLHRRNVLRKFGKFGGALLGGGFKYFLFSFRNLGQIPILASIFFRWVGTTN